MKYKSRMVLSCLCFDVFATQPIGSCENDDFVAMLVTP
ncbi:hypothetical protein EV13_2014 [Prochlorococcus sp. MIT 0702]|nr:hypothetical protein EV13_2014 [Prochlorococcus sp. MIT 0702]